MQSTVSRRPIDPTDVSARAGAKFTVLGSELQEGDFLYFLSSAHRITHFADYTGPLSVVQGGPMPLGTRIAYSGDRDDPKCWGMTIDPNMQHRIG